MLFLLILVFGACVGSFLNVVILRTHEGGSFLRGRSMCLSCKSLIRFFDLIPILSFAWLRGKCRACQSKISWQYILVESTTAILFLLMYLKQTLGFVPVSQLLLVRDWIFVSFLVIIFVYDFAYRYILDRFSIPAIVIALLLNVWIGSMPILAYVLGALVIGGFFLAQYVFSRGTWIGDGDIRLGVLIGVMLGLTQGLVALFFAYVFGAIVGIVLLVMKKVTRKTEMPFGTFLAGATVLMLFLGPQLIDWYLRFVLQ